MNNTDFPTNLFKKYGSIVKRLVGQAVNGFNNKYILPLPVYFSSRMNFGDHIFDYEWDLLIILDTCRPDALRAVANEYPFISNVEERWSVGGTSAEWVANTFDRQYLDIIKNTAYISSNPMAVSVLDNQFQQRFDGESKLKGSTQRLKKYGKYDVVKPKKIGKYRNLYETGVTKHGIYPSPRAVTDHGIQTDRLDDFDRIILHYMPPHHP